MNTAQGSTGPENTGSADSKSGDIGQATAEYALVLLGAAAIALILIGWATGGGGARIGGILDHVVSAITGKVR